MKPDLKLEPPTDTRCPQCKSLNTGRFYNLLYRCEDCFKRFFPRETLNQAAAIARGS